MASAIEVERVGNMLIIVETETFDDGDIESLEWTTMADDIVHETSEDDIVDEESV